MGVNAAILVALDEPCTREDLARWSAALEEHMLTRGWGTFFPASSDEPGHPGRHLVSLVHDAGYALHDLYRLTPEPAHPPADVIEVETLERYCLGPECERWDRIRDLLEWLRENLQGSVYYGSDGDCEARLWPSAVLAGFDG